MATVMSTGDMQRWQGLFVGDSTAEFNHNLREYQHNQPVYEQMMFPPISSSLWKSNDEAIKNLLIQIAEKVLPYLKGDEFERMLGLMIELGYSALEKEDSIEKHLGDELFDL